MSEHTHDDEWWNHRAPSPIERKLDEIMTGIQGLQAAASQISTDVQNAVAALDDLSARVAAGDAISQADVDAVTSTLTQASAKLDQAVATDDPSPASAPSVPDAPASSTDAGSSAPELPAVTDTPAADVPAPVDVPADSAPAVDEPTVGETTTSGATPGTTEGDPAPGLDDGTSPGVTTTQPVA